MIKEYLRFHLLFFLLPLKHGETLNTEYRIPCFTNCRFSLRLKNLN